MRMGWAKYEASPPSYVESNRVARVARAPPPVRVPARQEADAADFLLRRTNSQSAALFLGPFTRRSLA